MSDGQPEWISLREAAKILGVSDATVRRSLVDQDDPDAADHFWGAGNWRRKPLSRRGILQVRRTRAEEIAAESIGSMGQLGEATADGDADETRDG